PWDNCGLQAGNIAGPTTGVVVSVNPSYAAAARAVARGANLLITHHPLLFKATRSLPTDRDPGKTMALLLAHDVTCYAAHTNLDVTACNHRIADLLGWSLDGVIEPLAAISPNSGEAVGLGLYGDLPEAATLCDIADRVRQALAPQSLRLVGDPDRPVGRIGVCSGSGGDLVHAAADRGVELYITGEVRYHTALEALERGLAILEVGHQASEEPVVEVLVGFLKERLPAGLLVEAFHEPEPFRVL
ncbi:MAG: Nif3-like dinuclear metal center hexameric protein, partial [Cyanobacteria bacterium REEB65]|nr:Nif3-like dinuclear metal center hexameric protein [Cyanobacteria bacterium REEB65]